ncbi:hypothetical protein MPSEU_001001700 [Mayamaea pseudoterrestris]|nr:hypothetical protein MPSEU_001001700 [Mayamaea pseudoterrestris]
MKKQQHIAVALLAAAALPSFTLSLDYAKYQPKVQYVDSDLPEKVVASLSYANGSPWCNNAPTFWMTGHQWENTTESPYCYENGSWKMSETVALDKTDALALMDSDAPRIDRHACVGMDVNHDGLLDIICVVGADSGKGTGYNELYFTQNDGTILKMLEGHGLQKYPSMRTRIATVLRGPDGKELIFVGTLGMRRMDGLPNSHRMFQNDYVDANVLPYFNEVAGPFRKYYSAVCAVPFDVSKNGVDDLIVCNEKGLAGIYFQNDVNGAWTEPTFVGRSRYYLYGWKDVRIADVTSDGFVDLIVVAQDIRANNYLRIFRGRRQPPYFDFMNVYYEVKLRYMAPGLELLDVDQNGLHDIYVVQNSQTRGTYCGLGNQPAPWGNNWDTPPATWVPPIDTAYDLLFVGKRAGAKPGMIRDQKAFEVVRQNIRIPGCGGQVVEQFGNNHTMILAQGDFGHAGYNSILTWTADGGATANIHKPQDTRPIIIRRHSRQVTKKRVLEMGLSRIDVALLILHLVIVAVDSFAPYPSRFDRPSPRTSYIITKDHHFQSLTRLFAALPTNYQDYGNDCIARAALMVGARVDQLDIKWKPGRIVITVSGETQVGITNEEYYDEYDEDDDDDGNSDDDMENLDKVDDADVYDEAEDGEDYDYEADNLDAVDMDYDDSSSSSNKIVDLSMLARAVSDALNDDGLGASIAETHEIEVTTPGASDELVGLSARQFNSYKGFDVSVVYMDDKAQKPKTIQGRLVGREAEITTINIKGRMKKLSNSDVQSIKLPKAKRE